MDLNKDKELSASLEDYLESIFHLEEENRVARAKDIADRVGVARASVTTALKTLAEKGLINYEPYNYVTLTTLGKKLAAEVVRRHKVLKDFFQNFLRLDAEHADANACRVEHVMDQPAFERMVEFLAFMKECPRTGPDWIDSFERVCRGDTSKENCRQCLNTCMAEAEKYLP
jgi:DtxR family Mn-dependent transcriptional regulator